ncbi:hypothetical protein Q8F55_002185 [Vanrija albida]|uniref:Uncharacterized protein n=1 Tax=Vanrija albida TaxID=181172 RepID=A0ABR3Q940_9TREE
MPVTKKKGAMFAIYADSPPKESPTGVSGASSARSPSKKPSGTRRALTALEPAATRRGFPSSAGTGLSGADRPVKAPLGKLPSKGELRQPLGAKLGTARPAAKPKAAPKRQFEIFADPAPSSSSAAPRPASKRRPEGDKENAAPDSPSARTRSKARVADPAPKGKAAPLPPRRALADQPLADVSLAYGAEGDEPEGFRRPASALRVSCLCGAVLIAVMRRSADASTTTDGHDRLDSTTPLYHPLSPCPRTHGHYSRLLVDHVSPIHGPYPSTLTPDT